MRQRWLEKTDLEQGPVGLAAYTRLVGHSVDTEPEHAYPPVILEAAVARAPVEQSPSARGPGSLPHGEMAAVPAHVMMLPVYLFLSEIVAHGLR